MDPLSGVDELRRFEPGLAELERVVVLGGRGEQALPAPDEVDQLLRQPRRSLVLDLSAMMLAEKVSYATKVLAAVVAVRATSGLPHWLIIDEAHHVLPAEGSSAADLLGTGREALCLITLAADALAPRVRGLPNAVASTDLDAFRGLTELQERGRLDYALRVAVRSDETPSELAEEADAMVDGTDGVRDLLRALLL